MYELASLENTRSPRLDYQVELRGIKQAFTMEGSMPFDLLCIDLFDEASGKLSVDNLISAFY